MKINNASVLPKRYYALHMVEGLAEYKDIKHNAPEPFRVLLSENTIKKMDGTFTGCPVYVNHRPDVDLARLQEESDGYVIRSFYNPPDGKHWAEILIVSDRGHDAIAKGWAVSNAYTATMFGNDGKWHAMPYAKEILDARYDHLALVQKPRYQESIVLTPEDFKTYNERKEAELVSLQNSLNDEIQKPIEKKSKGVSSMLLPRFWNKAEADNAEKVVQLSVQLPRSQREITILQLINEADEAEMKKKENSEEDDKKKKDLENSETKDKDGKDVENDDDDSDELMNDDSDIDMGDGKKMKLGDLKKQYNELCAARPKNSEEMTSAPPLATPAASVATTPPGAGTMQNSLDTLTNAEETFQNSDTFETVPFDTLAAGRSKYGSKK